MTEPRYGTGPIFRDGRVYDLLYGNLSEDIPFYVRQAKKTGGPVLELGCGTGRVTIPLAEEGFEVWGIDLCESMLGRARAKAESKGLRIRWVRGDFREFHLGREFRLVLIPWNTISLLPELHDLEAFFHCVREHLAGEGRFVVDFFNPRLDFLIRDPHERRPLGEYDDPDGAGRAIVEESNAYNAAKQVNSVMWYCRMGTPPRETAEELRMRIFFPQELDALLTYNGFEIEAKYGGYDESPFESYSPKQIVVCRKRVG